MKLEKIVIVLDHPDESRNIGAACRAMANNDISELRIVGNKSDYDIEHIHVLAIHAGAIFDNAKFYDSIKDATADCTVCAGTTRRSGKKRGKLLLPEESIPSSNNFGSLNLSHAVQIICYHLFRKKLSEREGGYKGVTPVSLQRIDQTVQRVTDDMQEIGFFKMPGREDMENFWRSILSRSAITESEAQYLEKIFSKIAGLSKKKKNVLE